MVYRVLFPRTISRGKQRENSWTLVVAGEKFRKVLPDDVAWQTWAENFARIDVTRNLVLHVTRYMSIAHLSDVTREDRKTRRCMAGH